MPSLTLDADLEPLIPGYLQRREEDVALLNNAIASSDYATIKSTGHNLKGSGAGYGFDDITTIGSTLEQAGINQDAAAASAAITQLEQYLQSLEIRYEAM